MAGFNAIEYARNVGKSVKFISFTAVKNVNPTLTQYASDNVSAVRDMYDSIKDFKQTARNKAVDAWKGETGKFGRDLIKNALDDIKSGKFYNEERSMNAMNDFMDIDIDFDDSSDSGKSQDTADQTVTSMSMDYIMGKSSKSNAKAAITSADIVSKNIKGSTRTILAHNERMTGNIVTALAAVHGSIIDLNKSLTGPLNTHIQNSTTFYKTATEQLALQTGYLKELKELFTARYGQSKSTGGFGSSKKVSAWKSVMGGDLPDLMAMGRTMKDRVKNEASMLSMIASFFDNDMLKMMRASDEFNSPIAALLSMGLSGMMRNSRTGRGLNRFTNNLGGMFATGLGKINAWGRSSRGMNSMILGPLARMFGSFLPKATNRFNTANYEKGRVDWTGMADKALREVIPTQLAQILAALTGKEPKIFDYNTGRWTTAKNINNQFRQNRQRAINQAQGRFRDEVLNKFNTAYGTTSRSKASQSFKQDYDNLMEIIARTNVDPTNPTELKNYLKRKGLLGSGDRYYIHEENFDRIMQILGFAPSSGRFGNSRGLGFGFARAAYNAREANSDYMNSTSATGGAYNMVRSGGFSRTGNRNIGGFGIASITDDKGNNVFFYLQSFYSDLKAIRHALVNGSPNTKRKAGRKKYGSSMSNEDLRRMTEVPDNSRSSSGFSNTSRQRNTYYDPNVEENLGSGGFRQTREQSIFDRINSDDGLSEEELKNMNWFSRQFYRINRKWKNYNKDKDSANTVFDAFSESLMDVMFGKERDKNLLENGIAGLLQELPDKIAEATTEFGKRMWDRFKDSRIFQAFSGGIQRRWKAFKESDGFKRYASELKSAPKGFMKNAFSRASKDFKGAFGAVRSHLRGEDNEPGTAAYGGQVLRSGVVSVSEGEYIIPAEYNPYYTGHMGKSSRRAIESMNKRGFLNSASSRGMQYWGEYAKGGFVNAEAIKNFAKNRKKNKEDKENEKQYKSFTFRAARFGAKVGKKAAKKGAEVGAQEARDVFDDIQSTEAYQAVSNALREFYVKTRMFSERMFGENEYYQKGKAGLNKMINFIKPYLPETLAGGTIGALIGGALTGSPVGLLGGLIIGGGVNLARHSEEFSRTLFGDIDELGDRTGGIFSKKVSNFLTKKFPKMAQYGAVGSLLGAAGLAPGGILGGFVLGAGLNLLKDTEDFRNIMLGSKGVDGKRRGGLVTSIQLRVIDPLANYIQDELKGLGGYVKKWALDPLKNIFNPVRDWVMGVSSKMMEGINRAFKDRIVKPLAEKLDTILKPISGIAGWVAKKAVGLAKGIGTLPGRMVNTAANRLQLHNIRAGYSSLSPEERLQFMNQHSVKTKGANLASRLVNKIPGGSRVTGAISGFVDRHDFIGRHSGFSANAQAYTKYAAQASADELEEFYNATLGRDEAIRNAKRNNRNVRQELRDTLMGSMEQGGLNDPKARRILMRLLDSDGARKGNRIDSISQWIDEQEAAGKISPSNAIAAKQLVSEKMAQLSKMYEKEQTLYSDDWEARSKAVIEKSGLDMKYLTGKKGKSKKYLRRMMENDVASKRKAEARSRAEDAVDEAMKHGKEFAGGSDKKLKEAMDNNPVEKEKLGIMERIANMLSSLVSKETGQAIENNNNSSFGKTKSATSSNKNNGQVNDEADGPDIKSVTTDDGTQIQLRRNSEGGYSPDMSDAATAEYYTNKEQDRSVRNNFFSKMVGAGGLLDSLKNLFGRNKKDEGEKEPSLLEKLWNGAKSLGSSITSGIGNAISTIGGALSSVGGLSNLLSTGLGGVKSAIGGIGTKLGGLGNLASIAISAKTAYDFIKNIQENGWESFLKNPFGYSDEQEAEALGYKRTYYDKDEYQRDYTLESANKNILKYGVLGGSKRYGKTVNKIHKGFKKGLEWVGGGGVGRAAGAVKGGFQKAVSAGSGFLTGKAANTLGKSEAGYKLLDKAYSNKALTAINDKGVIGAAAGGVKSLASKGAGAVKSGIGAVGNKIANTGLGKAVSGAASSTGITAFVGKVKDVVKKILSVLGKSADDGILAMVDDVAKGLGQSVLKGASGLASKLAKALPFINWIMYGLAFENGMEDAYAVLQISPAVVDSVSLPMRALSGGATLLSEVLFGLVKPELCANILMTVLDFIGIADFSDIKNAQEITKQEFETYNAEHPGEEYNNVYEYLKNVYNLYTTQDKVKKVVGGAVSKVTGGIKAVGGFVAEKGKALVEGAKNLGGKAIDAVKGFGKGVAEGAKSFGKGVANVAGKALDKVKDVGSAAVSVVKGGVKNVLNFGGWIKEGITSITKMQSDMNKTFFQKDTNMSDVMDVDVQVSEDNPLGGIIKGIGGAVKIATVPVLFIKGLGGKLFNDVLKPMVGRVVDTGKSVLTTVTTALGFMTKGDPVGLLQYNTDNSVGDGSNPIGFVNSAAGLAVKLCTIVPTAISWVGHRVWDGLKAIGNGIKTVADSVMTSATTAEQYRQSGDIVGLFNMDSGNQDGVLGFLSGATDLVSKIAFAGPTVFTAVGIKVKELFGTIAAGFGKIADSAEISRTKANEYREAGDLKGLFSMDSSESGGENTTSGPLDFISTVQDVGHKIIFALPTAFVALGKGIKSALGLGGNIKTLSVTEMISKLWEYTDATKHPTMDDYDQTVESLSGGGDGLIGSAMSVASTVIGGLMKGIISIARPVVSFGKGIKDSLFGIFDSVKDFVTGDDDEGGEDSGSGSGIHVSQYGSKASRRRFGRSTVGKNGCGPAAAATVLRSYGKNADLDGTVDFAQANGYVAGASGMGTKAGYFGDILGRNGISTRYTRNKSSINNAIGSGNPAILLGQDKHNTSKANSPFGPNPHYVVARGKDSRGNIVVDDPELGNTAIYSNKILNNSKLGILTGGDSGIVYENVSENTNAGKRSTSGTTYGISYGTSASENTNAGKRSSVGTTYGISYGTSASENTNASYSSKSSLGYKTTTSVGSSLTNNTGSMSTTATQSIDGDYVGKHVKQFESGTKGSSTISSGTGDYGGVSFGSYQFPSYKKAVTTDGSLPEFWNKYFAAQYPGVQPGDNQAFKNAWLDAVNKDPAGFFNKEHAFIAAQYYTPVSSKLASNGVGDPTQYNRAAQEAAWSSAVQYGPGLAASVFQKSGVNSSMNPVDYINKLYDYKIATVGSTFKSSSKSVQNSIANRYAKEKQILLGLTNLSPIDPNSTNGVTVTPGTTASSGVSSGFSSGSSSTSGFDLGSMLSGIFGNVFRAVGNKIGGTIGGFISSVFGGNTTDNTNSSSTSSSGIFGSSGVSSGAFVSSADASATEKKAIDAMNSIMGKNSYTMSADRERVFDTVDKGSSIGYGDCSATVRKVLQRATGINIGGNTDDQYNNYASRGGVVVADSHGAGASKSATIDLSKLRPGDALYYSRPDSSYTAGRKDRVGHVEMYMGDGKRAGHGSGMGPRISNATDDQNRFLKAIRFIKDSGTNISSSTDTDATKLTTNTVAGTDITATGSGLPIIDFTRNEYNDISRRVPSVRKHSNKTGGASGITLPTSVTGGSYSNIDPQTMMQFFNQVIALLTSIAQSSGYTPTIVSVLQMMTGTMNAMNSPKTEDTKNQIDQNIALMMQKLDTISQTL